MMEMIEVGRTCALCRAKNKIMLEKDKSFSAKSDLADIVFCEECRKRLMRLLYEGDLK